MENVLEGNNLILFEKKELRKIIVNGQWYYSVVDVVSILTESKDANAYWRKLKQRLLKEKSECVTNCHALELVSKKDGKSIEDKIGKKVVTNRKAIDFKN